MDPMPGRGAPGGPVKRFFLVVSAVLFIGWIGWLAVTALTKSRAPVVSHSQAANAKVAVRAKLATGTKDTQAVWAGPGGRGAQTLHGDSDRPAFVVTVVESLTPNGPANETQIGVVNLPGCGGYTGPGEYLLLLEKAGDTTIDNHPAYALADLPRSPAADPSGAPPIYPWTDATGADLRAQVKRLFP
jgi:hypothetical protein